ncbi:MAG: hypothetical protein EXR62_16090 [Chloroflexi bacterium]|nr:hypothetical protein [Chloroflexota bacterium]
MLNSVRRSPGLGSYCLKFRYGLLAGAHLQARSPSGTGAEVRDTNVLSKINPIPRQTIEHMTALNEVVKRLRTEVLQVKQAATAQPTRTTMPKRATRDIFIDLLLKEAD